MRWGLRKEAVGLLVTRREIERMEVERKGSIVGYLRLLEELWVYLHDRFPKPVSKHVSHFLKAANRDTWMGERAGES